MEGDAMRLMGRMRTWVACLWCAFAGLGQAKPERVLPDGVALEEDVAYLAEGRSEKLDLYQPAGAPGELRPAVVIIHGGGWIGGDKGAAREFQTGTTLAGHGYVCASIEYWKGASERWPKNLQDCKNAVRWLRVNAARLHVDPARIGVIGGSAGGHLALMVAYTGGRAEYDPKPLYPGVSDSVSACVNLYGIADLLTRQGTDAQGNPNGVLSPTQLFPESREVALQKWKDASPIYQISPKSPPTLTLHGMGDTTVDRDQSRQLHAALIAAGVESELILVQGANHAWSLQTAAFDHRGDVLRFFDRHLRGTVTPSAP